MANWMRKAFKPSHKGLLHKDLNVPEGEKIPDYKMRAALRAKYGRKVQQRAQAAHNANS